MRILFLSHYFPPEVNAPASRTFEHCRYWVAAGHDVTVVTCAPNHPQGIVYQGYRNRLFQRERRDGINVIRLWTYVTANEGVLKRTLNYLSYMVSVIIAIPWLPKSDVVISTSPQFFNGLAGYVVSRIKRTPWALEIRDLWPESILTVGAIRNKMIIRLLSFLESFAYRKADRIVAVTDAFKVYMVNKGIPPEKIEVIKNGVDLKFFRSASQDDELAAQIGAQGKFVVSYVGTLGMAHHLETVLEAAKRLEGQKDILFVMAGDGAERKKLLSQAERMALRNVTILGQVPKEKMPALWSLTNISLVLLKKSNLFRTVIPSKIFESMAMKKAVVLGVEGESREIIQQARAGIWFEPENSDELVTGILRLYNAPDLCMELGNNGRRYVEQYFDRSTLAKRFERLMMGMRRE